MSQILTILGSVGFDWHVALANFVNFLIILALLNVLFFKKLKEVITKREHVIEKGLRDAQEAANKLHEADKEKEALLREARHKESEIIKAAHTRGEAIAASYKDEQVARFKGEEDRLSKKEAALTESVEQAFREKAPLLVARLYAKTLAKELTKEDNDALIASMKL